MKQKRLVGAAMAATMMTGIGIGAVAMPPMSALAADSSTAATADATARTPGQWITDSLKGLVDKGTITQAQSDEVAATLKSAEPMGGRHGGPRMDLSAVANVLGMSEEDLRTAQQTKSIADIAKDKNVDPQKVIDTLVAADNTRIDQAVADGKLTQAQADERKANTVERVTKSVNTLHAMKGAPPAVPADPPDA